MGVFGRGELSLLVGGGDSTIIGSFSNALTTILVGAVMVVGSAA